MKNKDLYQFKKGLEKTKFEHPRVTYAVNKNKRMVRQTIEDMEDIINPSEKVSEFFKEREKLAMEYCEKDENGNPKLRRIPGMDGEIQTVYSIPDQTNEKSKYRKELSKLEKKFETEIKEHEEKLKKYNEEFINDESDYKPFMLPLSLVEAHEKCPQEIMDMIFWMIDDTK
jgi:hypothetical protein